MSLAKNAYFLAFIATFSIVSLITPLIRRLAIRYDIFDQPNAIHKTHKSPVPYLGGIAIVIGITLVSYTGILLANFDTSTVLLASSVLIPAIAMATVGLIDDLKARSPWSRFLVQNVVAFISTCILIKTNTVGSPTGSMIIDVCLSVSWIVGITNAVNFFDNLDGGASTTLLVSSFFLSVLAFYSQQYVIAALSISISGALCGFFIWNRPPARIYMGDAGALFLGTLISSLTLRLDTLPINKLAGFVVPLLLLALPIIDTSVAVISRVKRGVSPFQGGRDHISHRLMNLGLSKKQTVAIVALITCYFAVIAFIISFSPHHLEIFTSCIGILSMVIAFVYFIKIKISIV